MDAVPGLSQIKSIAQWATGNTTGALKTQENFLQLCPLVSQCTSIFQVLFGDWKGALETQKKFVKGFLNGILDSVPVLGHLKGVVQYICGYVEEGKSSMKAATHSTCVIGGGIGGFLLAGPAGAAVGGSCAGLLMDEVFTVVDSSINGDFKPYGTFDPLVRIIVDPKDGGNYVDLIGCTVMYGITGYVAGNWIGGKIKYNSGKRKLAKMVGKKDTKDIIDVGESMRKIHADNDIRDNKPHVMTRVKDNGSGYIAYGHNKQIRNVLNNNNYMTNGQTELEKKVLNAKPALERPFSTCAESQAYNCMYIERPDASPGDLSGVSVRWDKNKKCPVTVARCENCKVLSPAMGEFPTDLIPDKSIPKRVRFRHAAAAAAVGVGVHALANEVDSQAR